MVIHPTHSHSTGMNAFPANYKPRILVIDDNPAIHQDFRKILQPKSDVTELDAAAAAFFDEPCPEPTAPTTTFDVDFAHQGRESLAMVETAMTQGMPYAMAFVDVRMPPGWDGIETIANLWKVHPDLQVVICTAYSDYSWNEIAARLPISDQLLILKKPFDTIEVLQMANALTAKWQLTRIAALHAAQLEKLAATRTVELFKSVTLFRLIAENTSDLITIWTNEGERLYSSPSYRTVLGINPAALLDTPLSRQVHPEDREEVRAAVERSTHGGCGNAVVCRMEHRDGSWRTFDAQINPAVNEAGEVSHVVVIARNLVGRRSGSTGEMGPAEAELARMHRMGWPADPRENAVYEIELPR